VTPIKWRERHIERKLENEIKVEKVQYMSSSQKYLERELESSTSTHKCTHLCREKGREIVRNRGSIDSERGDGM
jgi:hypothetical protein